MSDKRSSGDSRLRRAVRNIVRLFVDDVRRLGGNVVTAIIVLGLVALPSIFSWYNILACWDVFGNTGNLTVAVANSDEGYTSDLMPLKLTIGDKIESALRENDQLNWVFTTEDDAIDGARSGRYYAAVVIPASFSADMMSFYSDDMEHAKITYYSNQKKNAIAPKVTDRGADQVSDQVNEVFAETIADVALSISSALVDYVDRAGADSAIGELGDHVARLSASMRDSANVISLYQDTLDSSLSLIKDSSDLFAQAKGAADDVASGVGEAKQSADSIEGAMRESVAALSTALDQCSASYAAVPSAIDAAFDSASALAGDSSAQLRNMGQDVDAQAQDLANLKADVESIAQVLPGDAATAASNLAQRIQSSIDLLQRESSSLYGAADKLDAKSAGVEQARADAKSLAQQAGDSLDEARSDYDENLKPSLESLAATIAEAGESVSGTAALVDEAGNRLAGDADSLSTKIAKANKKLQAASKALVDSAEELDALSASISSALSSEGAQALRTVIGSDPSALASALSAPVKMERNALYPVENFGSAMSPLYTTLALWIGALLIMVALKVVPSERQVSQLDRPTSRQLFLGRFGVVSLISLLQSTTLALGNMFFLGVQTVHPLLYLVCFWVAGLVFAFIIYSLVSLFANLGKALAVMLLILQVSAGGGSFPLALLPQAFQDASPFLPVAHAVNAMRAAMFGVYQGDFWMEIGTLVLFVVPIAAIVLVFHGLLSKVVPRFVERVERSKLI